MKDRVYADNPQSIEALRTNIRRIIGGIESQICKNVIEHLEKRINVYKRVRSAHLSNIILFMNELYSRTNYIEVNSINALLIPKKE